MRALALLPRSGLALALLLPAGPAPAQPRPADPPATFRCGERRYCSEMRSCAEAMFHFRVCGLHRLDGDGDGVPCERLCGAGPRPRRR
jgi:hypothetical protein